MQSKPVSARAFTQINDWEMHIADSKSVTDTQMYLQWFEVNSFQVCIDYQPKRVDYRGSV